MTHEETKTLITPIIQEVYGKGVLAEALIDRLTSAVSPYSEERNYDRDRKQFMLEACWNMFPGGDTAELVANRLEAALQEAGI